MRCLPEVYNDKGSLWVSNLSTEMKSMTTKVAKQIPKWPQVGYVACDKISFFECQ